jgi:hypothetical protein
MVRRLSDVCKCQKTNDDWKAIGKRIAAELGVGVGTLYRLSLDGSKIRERVI